MTRINFKKLKQSVLLMLLSVTLFNMSCRDKKNPKVEEPPPAEEPTEVITTFKLVFTDSASGGVSSFMFRDPDGPGGTAAYYGPDANSQADSVITLGSGKTYYARVILLNESTSPADTVSKEVKEEGAEHMLFYNAGNQAVLYAGNPLTIKISPDVVITYLDLDNGTPQRGIGLETKWRTPLNGSSAKYPLTVSLKHQPESKDGTFAPGETDIEVNFKLKIE